MDQYQIISNFKAGHLKLLYDAQEEENTPKNPINLSLRYFFSYYAFVLILVSKSLMIIIRALA